MKKILVLSVIALGLFVGGHKAQAFSYGYIGSVSLVGQTVPQEYHLEATVVPKKLSGNTVIVDLANRLREEDRPIFFRLMANAGIRF